MPTSDSVVPAAGCWKVSRTGATPVGLLDTDGVQFMERVGLRSTPNVVPMAPKAGEGVKMTMAFAIGPFDIVDWLSGT